jgi:ribosomal protein S18 acetylase RimI-like enzyme
MVGMSIRTVTPDDSEAIAAVGTATWHDTYDEIIGREAVEERVAEWYDPETVRGYFEDDAFGAYVATRDGDVVGYAYSRPAGEVDVWSLPAIYVHPDAQGERFGRALLARVEQDAREADASVVRLVVLAANDSARGFYEAHGYDQVDEREDPTVDGTRELVYETTEPAT